MVRKYTGQRLVRVKLRAAVVSMAHAFFAATHTTRCTCRLTSLSTISLRRRRSRAGSSMTSPFNLRSAASPDTGLLPAVVDGLSFALTQGARPWSGISRVTLPYIAAMSWLWRCSLYPSGEDSIGSMRAVNSAWLRRPAPHKSSAPVNLRTRGGSTNEEVGYGLLVGRPLLRADARLERRVDGLEVDAGRYKLAGLGRFV